LAKYTVIQPKMPTTAANLMVILRPSTSARRPLVRAPIIAPIVKTDAKTPNYRLT